jgi:prepilin-type N-terminal cleavage/methylation domain-containing protein
MSNLKRGFTLIELLIVIALLGALAVGLLAALDPFEQLKKGVDTGVRNTTSEFHGAVIRYYSIKNYMPWCSDSTCSTVRDGSGEPSASTLTNLTNTITEIVTTGELKSDFSSLAGSGTLSKIYVTGSNSNASVYTCFKPTAKSFISDPNTKFESNGTEVTGNACKSQGGSRTDCYWCVK